MSHGDQHSNQSLNPTIADAPAGSPERTFADAIRQAQDILTAKYSEWGAS